MWQSGGNVQLRLSTSPPSFRQVERICIDDLWDQSVHRQVELRAPRNGARFQLDVILLLFRPLPRSIRILGESLEQEVQGGLGALDADLPDQQQQAQQGPRVVAESPEAAAVERAAAQAFDRLGSAIRDSAEIVQVCLRAPGPVLALVFAPHPAAPCCLPAPFPQQSMDPADEAALDADLRVAAAAKQALAFQRALAAAREAAAASLPTGDRDRL